MTEDSLHGREWQSLVSGTTCMIKMYHINVSLSINDRLTVIQEVRLRFQHYRTAIIALTSSPAVQGAMRGNSRISLLPSQDSQLIIHERILIKPTLTRHLIQQDLRNYF